MEGKGRRFGKTVAFKTNLIISLTLIAGIGAIIVFFTVSVTQIRELASKTNLEQQAALLYTSIENFMLSGEAPIAVRFFEDLKAQKTGFQVDLYRTSGKPAFSDNETISGVNTKLGLSKFALQLRETPISGIENDPSLEKATSIPPLDVNMQETQDGKTWTRIMRPLINLPKCTSCHGSDHTIRGVIDIKNDITATVQAQGRTVQISGILFISNVLILILVISIFLSKVVLSPVKSIGTLCKRVTEGDFSGTITLKGTDEIAELGKTVNSMVSGLRERFELTKYVSASTIQSLGGNQAGKKEVLTVLFTDIRGFTSYTETHAPDHVVSFLNKILDVQSELIHSAGGDVDKFVGDAVLALFQGDAAERKAVQAAIEIQARFAKAGQTEFDGLTVGIGIATGEIIHGMIGSHRRADFTVIGDSVNIASRLCSAAKAGQTIVCDTTKQSMGTDIALNGPYRISLKGKDKTQRVWVIGGKNA